MTSSADPKPQPIPGSGGSYLFDPETGDLVRVAGPVDEITGQIAPPPEPETPAEEQ